MSNKVRDALGQFAPKSEVPRKVRSVNLTDDAWQWLAAVAEKAGMSRNDYLEALAEGSIPFMEMAAPLMEMAPVEIETDGANIMQQPNSEAAPLMETVQAEIESFEQQLRSQSRRLEEQDQELLKLYERNSDLELEVQNLKEQLEAEPADLEKLEAELSGLKGKLAAALEQNEKSAPIAIGVEVRSQLETGYADREEIEAEFSELKQNSASVATLSEKLPLDAATILSQLRARRKKSKTDLADLEAILEILES